MNDMRGIEYETRRGHREKAADCSALTGREDYSGSSYPGLRFAPARAITFTGLQPERARDFGLTNAVVATF